MTYYYVWSDGTWCAEEDMVHMAHMSDDCTMVLSDDDHIEEFAQAYKNQLEIT